MWTYGAYAAQGTSHQQINLPCQDAVSILCHDNVLIAAIADGAGSTTHGGIGAQIAVTVFQEYCSQQKKKFTSTSLESICTKAYAEIQKTIQEKAVVLNLDVKEFATTFMGAILTENQTVLCHCGDGFIVGRGEGTYQFIDGEDDKEFVNQTSFITDKNNNFHVKILPYRLNFLSMGTDGLASVSIEQATNKAYAGFFKPFDEYLQQKPSLKDINQELKKFLYSPRLNERTQDDKSLLIARWTND